MDSSGLQVWEVGPHLILDGYVLGWQNVRNDSAVNCLRSLLASGEGNEQAWLCLGSIGQSREVGGTEITGGRKTPGADWGKSMKTPPLGPPYF